MNLNGTRFSLHRWWSIVLKEFLQLRRDRVTFAMMIGIPIMQLLMFGFAINTDPKHLPTGVIAADRSEFTRSFLASLRNTDYFRLDETLPDEAAGRQALAEGGCSSSSAFRPTSPAGWCAASAPRCWSRPTRPTLRRRAWRWPLSRSSRRAWSART